MSRPLTQPITPEVPYSELTPQQHVHLECARRGRVWGNRAPVEPPPQRAFDRIDFDRQHVALLDGSYKRKRHLEPYADTYAGGPHDDY